MTQVIAHRTCPRDAVENSRAGIGLAGRLGATAVQIDVRLSADGVPVLSHDRTTRRVTGVRHVVRRTPVAVLENLRIGRTEETLPTLWDAIDALPDGMDLAVDVREPAAMAATVDVLAATGMLHRARLWTRHPGTVPLARQRAPDRQVALLHHTMTERRALRYLEHAARLGATAVCVMDISATDRVVARGRELGLFVNCWVRTEKVQARVLACAPDAVVTDWVADAVARVGA